MSALKYSQLTYDRPDGIYTYPGWAVGIGWFLASLPLSAILITALYKLMHYTRSGKVKIIPYINLNMLYKKEIN